jgi:hypothetical protein
MSWDYQNKQRDCSWGVAEAEEGTVLDLVKVACEELFPKFMHAESSRCAQYIGVLLLNKIIRK